MCEGGEEAVGALLGYALATMMTGAMVGAQGGQAVLGLLIAPRNRADPDVGRMVRQARLALGLLLLWMIYLFVHIFTV